RLLSAKMLRISSSTTSTLRPLRGSSPSCSASIMRCFASGRSAITRRRNRAVSSSSRSGERTPLSTMLLAALRSSVSSASVSSRPVKLTTGARRRSPSCCTAAEAVLALVLDGQELNRDMACFGAALELSEHRPTQHVREEHIERHGARAVLVRQGERIGAGPRQQDLESPLAREIEQDAAVM